MRNPFGKLVLVLSILLIAVAMRAQTVAGITGVVTDQTGAVVPGATVTLENTQTGASYATVTNSVGSYTLNEVKPGPGYKMTFTHGGFKPLAVTGIYMNVDSTRVQNGRLTIGTEQQTVEVSAAAENVTLDTTDATVGNNFQVQELNDLPVQDRSNPTALFYQQPGVTDQGAVTGARTDQSNVTLDGLEVNDNATGQFGTIVGNAPVDSVQEFRGVTAGQAAANMSWSPAAAPTASMEQWSSITAIPIPRPTTGSATTPARPGLRSSAISLAPMPAAPSGETRHSFSSIGTAAAIR
jgi:hypothetical protein